VDQEPRHRRRAAALAPPCTSRGGAVNPATRQRDQACGSIGLSAPRKGSVEDVGAGESWPAARTGPVGRRAERNSSVTNPSGLVSGR
jgi:hypothetical protein